MQLVENQHKATGDIIELIAAKLGSENRKLDIDLAISTCARLAGSFMFRSFGFKTTDNDAGSVLLSENANIKGPELLQTTRIALHNYGIVIDPDKMKGFTPEKSKIDFIYAIDIVQNEALDIMNKYELSYEQFAHSAALATAFIIQQSSNRPAEQSFSQAIYHYIEGLKTCPPDFINPMEATK